MNHIPINEMKQIELEIMDEVDSVCRKNNLQYFLAYGSCLGAVRHGGFIPWDDDMDIVMMREDYESFLKIFDKDKTKDYLQIVSYRDKSAPCPFTKIVNKKTWVEERYSESKHGSGIWVDVFPLDKVSKKNNKHQFRLCKRNSVFHYLTITKPSTGTNISIRIAKKILCPIFKLLGPYYFAKKIDEYAKSYKGESEYVADMTAEYDAEKIMKKSFFVPIEWDFEGHTYFIPKDYKELLAIWYGDWKTLPPESQREQHACNAYYI